MTAHARLSASGSHIWLTCTQAPIHSQDIPRRPSKWADEGTLAHKLAERELWKRGVRSEMQLDLFAEEKEDMLRYIGPYVDYVEALSKNCKAYWVEMPVYLDRLWDELPPPEPMWGTPDFIGIDKSGFVHVVDLKYGAGVAVETWQNTQLMYYGLAAALSLPEARGAHTVRLTIIQPRCPHPKGAIRHWDVPVIDLLIWGHSVLQPTVEDIVYGFTTGDLSGLRLVEGDHCRWCAANNGRSCPAKRKEREEKVNRLFSIPPTNS